MRNFKLERGLAAKSHWPHLGTVTIAGDDSAKVLPPGLSDEEKEEIVQSWQKVAVLKVTTDILVRLMFAIGDHAEFLRDPIITRDGLFGVHVGPQETRFIVFPDDGDSQTRLELIRVTTQVDPDYPDLPLY